MSPLGPASLRPSTIKLFSRFFLFGHHDRVRNHKGPISRDGELDFAWGPADQSRGASAQVGGTRPWVGGDTMPQMEKVPLFLVICVTTVLIDDHRDVFPTLP